MFALLSVFFQQMSACYVVPRKFTLNGSKVYKTASIVCCINTIKRLINTPEFIITRVSESWHLWETRSSVY